MRVTPRSSSAAAEPMLDRRCETLSMRASRPRRRGPPPPLPQPDHAVARPERDEKIAQTDQQSEAVAVEPDLAQEVDREDAKQHEYEGADERADGARDSAADGDDENVDRAVDADRAGAARR